LLEGKNVRLRIRDKEDLDFFFEFWNDLNCYGEYEAIQPQISKAEAQKRIENPAQTDVEWTWFVIEKKDGTRIGFIIHYYVQPSKNMTVGYALVPSETGKGYGTEALQIMVDYLFLTKDIMRVQATTDLRNRVSRRVLEKAGFKKEGTIRKSGFTRGRWTDECLYGLLREEWEEPRILTRRPVEASDSHAMSPHIGSSR
jgi:ribosomal-protein-alanine N-acetyltransferase